MDWVNDYYMWIKALHVISVIAWMAGMLYLPRLFVYHAEAPAGSDRSEAFKPMEHRLLRVIMNPAMIGVFLFGGLMLSAPGRFDWSEGWLYVKLALIGVLTALHHAYGLWRKDFAAGGNRRSARFYRTMHEIVTISMIGIVVMVIVRPF